MALYRNSACTSGSARPQNREFVLQFCFRLQLGTVSCSGLEAARVVVFGMSRGYGMLNPFGREDFLLLGELLPNAKDVESSKTCAMNFSLMVFNVLTILHTS